VKNAGILERLGLAYPKYVKTTVVPVDSPSGTFIGNRKHLQQIQEYPT
jgi:hypothetical protein